MSARRGTPRRPRRRPARLPPLPRLPPRRAALRLTPRDERERRDGLVGSLDGGAPVVLLERGSNPQYAEGFLFTVIDGNLVAQPFDAERKQLHGQAVPLADGVEFFANRDLGQYSVSGAGLAVYRRDAPANESARLVRPRRQVARYRRRGLVLYRSHAGGRRAYAGCGACEQGGRRRRRLAPRPPARASHTGHVRIRAQRSGRGDLSRRDAGSAVLGIQRGIRRRKRQGLRVDPATQVAARGSH